MWADVQHVLISVSQDLGRKKRPTRGIIRLNNFVILVQGCAREIEGVYSMYVIACVHPP